MNPRAVLGAWLGAFALLGVAIAALLALAPADRHPFAGAPVAVIGSSMAHHAIAAAGSGADSLLGDGRAHQRIGIYGITESEQLDLLREALDDRAQVVLIEANLLVRNLAVNSPERECDGWGARARALPAELQEHVAGAFRRLLQIERIQRTGTGEPEDLGNEQYIDPVKVRQTYPFTFRTPSCRAELDALLARARRQGTQVVLFVPPVSQAAIGLMPPGQEAELVSRARRLADTLALPLFAPHGPWPNADFVDNSHMNWRGRADFTAALRAWWQARQ